MNRRVVMGICLVVGLGAANAAVSLWNTRHLHHHAARVAHAQEVLANAAAVHADRLGIEAAHRTFLLTGDERAYEAFARSVASARASLARLRELTADDPDQQTRLAAVGGALDDGAAALERIAQVRRREGADAAGRAVAGETDRRLDEADRLLDEVEGAERAALAERERISDGSYSNSLLFATATAGCGLLAAGLFAWLLWQGMRPRATAAARREREWLQTTLASIGDAVITTDTAGRVTFLNPVATKLTGWPQAEAAGRPLTEVFRIVNEASRREVENPALRALREGAVVGLANHTLLIARDGSERPIDDSAAPIREPGGAVGGAVLVFRDISERKKAEEVQARLAAIVESSDDAMVSKTLDGVIRTWNAGAERVFGYTAAEAVGRPVTFIIPPERLDEELDILARLRRGERIDHFETVRVRKDGRRVDVSLTVSPIRDADGHISGASKVARDVTTARRAEQAARAGEVRDRFLLELAAATQPRTDPADIMATAARLLAEHLRADRCAYAEVEAESVYVITGDHARGVPSIVGRWPVGAFGAEHLRMMQAGESYVVANTDADPRIAPANLHAYRATSIRAVVCVPLHKGGRFTAAMAVHTTTPRGWTPAEVDLVTTVAGRCWEALERAAAERALAASRARLDYAARASGLGFWHCDLPFDVLNWDERVKAHFWLPPDAVVTIDTFYERLHPADRGPTRAAIERSIADRTVYDVHYRTVDPATWAEKWVRAIGGTAYDDAGQPQRFDGVTLDVTDRRRAEEQLRESEARFRTLFEAMDEGYCVVEPVFADGRAVDYRYLLANPALERHTGLRDVVGKTARQFMPTHESDWIEAYARVAATGEPVRRTDRVADLGRWFEVSAFPVGSGQVGVLFADVTARIEAEQAVRASEQRLAEVFRHAPSFMGVLRGPTHVFELANDHYRRLVGGRELIGKSVAEAVPEVIGQGFIDLLDRVYQTGEPYAATGTRLLLDPGHGRDAEERVLDFVYQPLRDAAGAVTGILVQGIDQTERVRAEAGLRERDERLQLFLGAATDYAVIISDHEGRVLEWLGGAEAVTGYPPAEAVGQAAGLLFTPEDRAAGEPMREMTAAARHGRAEDKRWHQKKNGDQFFADGVLVPLRAEGGELRGFGKVFRDVTARKRTEDAVRFLADASASLAELVDYESTLGRIANIAVAGFADWCVVDVLDAGGARRRLAVTQAEATDVASARAADATGPAGGPDGGIPHVLHTGEPEVVPDLTALNPATAPQGAERLARLRAWGVRSYLCVPLLSRGRVIGGITFLSQSARRRFGPDELRVGQDLAGRVASAIENAQLYRDLQEQDRRKDEFLATLAHELRNPLAPVRNGVQILKMGRDPERDAKTLGMMDRQLTHMVRMVDDLLDLSRVSSGKVVLRREPTDLRAAVDAAVETTRPAVEAGRHELSITLPDVPLGLTADRTRLAQIFANLLSNAAKYTPPGGRIGLTAARENETVVVRVTDTGIGIPADMLPRVFDLFTQVGAAVDWSQGGLGIGLTLVKRLVELHGGQVTADSPGPGQGSTFTVRLPLGPPAPAAADTPAAGRGTAPRLRVLVVDDNRDAAESLGLILDLKGHEVRTAFDGPEALRVLGAYRPHLILLDLGLPGMSGFEVARKVRESSTLAGVLLVALTGWGQQEDRRRTRAAGFDFHLVKPADADELEHILIAAGGRR